MKQFSNLDELALYLRHFSSQRNWDQYHSPKNLAAALTVEAAELLEHFQWLKQEESYFPDIKKKKEISHEMADILIYLTRMADILGINLLEAATDKVQINSQKYPAPLHKDKLS